MLDRKERLRLYSTLQTLVKVQLVLHLVDAKGLLVGCQTTSAITESILDSAEQAKVSLPEVHKLLEFVKTINYDRSTKSIYFFFYPQRAFCLQDVHIPLIGRVYKLTNAHVSDRGSV